MRNGDLESKSIDAFDFIIKNGPHFNILDESEVIILYDKVNFWISRVSYNSWVSRFSSMFY